jgi:hypothetical protein
MTTCLCYLNPCLAYRGSYGYDYNDDDSEQENKEFEVGYNDSTNNDSSEGCEMLRSGSQAFHRLYENSMGTAEAQNSSSITNSNYGEIPAIGNESSIQKSFTERAH